MSRRFKTFGKQVLIGDLAIRKEKAHLVDNELADEIEPVEDEE